MPPPHGAEGNQDVRAKPFSESPYSSYSSSSDKSAVAESSQEEEASQRQGVGGKRQRAHKSAVAESSNEEEASPAESASKGGKRLRLPRLHHPAVAAEDTREG